MHVCEIIERYFAGFAEDNDTPVEPIMKYAEDFLVWDEEWEKQEKILARVAPLIDEVAKKLFPFRKRINF